MGQCAPSSPDYSANSIDDDDVSFVMNPQNAVGCNRNPPLESTSFQSEAIDNVDTHWRSRITHNKFDHKERRRFLQTHERDIPQRRIVDQSEIKRAVWLQTDELLRRNGRLKMHGKSFEELQNQQILPMPKNRTGVGARFVENECSIRKSMHSEPSIVSGFTSASDATLVRTNTKRKPQHQKANVNEVDVPYQLSVPKHTFGTDLERHQCMSVLRLKMKANIGWFYTQRYLNMFPNELNPISGIVPGKDSGIPDLSSESWDSSFSSSCGSSGDDYHCINHGSMPPIASVKCPVTNESLFDLAITGCLGLVPREQDHRALRSSRRQLRDHYEKIPDHCIVLLNKRSGSPLAVCVLKTTSESTVVRIYATKQMAFAQKPTLTTQQLGLDWTGELPLYTWAEVKTEGKFPDKMNFNVFIVQRFDGCFSSEPRYKASFNGQVIDDKSTVRSPVIEVVGRTDNERIMSGCALIWIQADEKMTRTHSKNNSDLSFRINLAQGIEPSLLICFTAIVDEILEKCMRMRCQNQTRRLVRKDSFSLTKKRLEARSRVSNDDQIADVPCKPEFCTYPNLR